MVVFGPILLLLSSNENMHESLDDFEFSPDLADDYGVSCTLSVEHNCIHYFVAAIDLILFNLASFKDILQNLG